MFNISYLNFLSFLMHYFVFCKEKCFLIPKELIWKLLQVLEKEIFRKLGSKLVFHLRCYVHAVHSETLKSNTCAADLSGMEVWFLVISVESWMWKHCGDCAETIWCHLNSCHCEFVTTVKIVWIFGVVSLHTQHRNRNILYNTDKHQKLVFGVISNDQNQ